MYVYVVGPAGKAKKAKTKKKNKNGKEKNNVWTEPIARFGSAFCLGIGVDGERNGATAISMVSSTRRFFFLLSSLPLPPSLPHFLQIHWANKGRGRGRSGGRKKAGCGRIQA